MWDFATACLVERENVREVDTIGLRDPSVSPAQLNRSSIRPENSACDSLFSAGRHSIFITRRMSQLPRKYNLVWQGIENFRHTEFRLKHPLCSVFAVCGQAFALGAPWTSDTNVFNTCYSPAKLSVTTNSAGDECQLVCLLSCPNKWTEERVRIIHNVAFMARCCII
jgi:hypothetical protein